MCGALDNRPMTSATSLPQPTPSPLSRGLRAPPAAAPPPEHAPVATEALDAPPERALADPGVVTASRARAVSSESQQRARVVAGPLHRGSTGPLVRTLQHELNAAGSARPALVLDGDFGRRTEAALKRYQTSRGLEPSGLVDAPTRAALAERRPALPRELALGAFGPEVRALQETLNRHGAALTLDGDFGGGTERAVRAFQAANDLSIDGIVGEDTRALLARTDARRIPDDAPGDRATTGYRRGRPFPIELVSIGGGEALARPAAAAFRAMRDAAARDGVRLHVVSSFRSMDEQRALYAAYLRGDGNLAAQPGYSNHQSGIAVDITTGGSRDSASYRWLAKNAERFGFHNTVKSEPWHWEHLP